MGAAVGENHEEEEGGEERGNRTKKRKGRGTRVDRVPAAINRANESPLLFRLQPRSSLHLVHSSFFFLFSLLSLFHSFFFSSLFHIYGIADSRETQMEIGRVSRLAGVVLALISITTTWSRHGCCVAELYTALADMEELLETEAVLIDTLNGYIKAQEERLATLRK